MLVVTGFVFILGIGTGTSWEAAEEGLGFLTQVQTEGGWARKG